MATPNMKRIIKLMNKHFGEDGWVLIDTDEKQYFSIYVPEKRKKTKVSEGQMELF